MNIKQWKKLCHDFDPVMWLARGDWHEERGEMEDAARWRRRSLFGAAVDKLANLTSQVTRSDPIDIDGVTFVQKIWHNACGSIDIAVSSSTDTFRLVKTFYPKSKSNIRRRRDVAFDLEDASWHYQNVIVGFPKAPITRAEDWIYEARDWLKSLQIPGVGTPRFHNFDTPYWAVPFGAAQFLVVDNGLLRMARPYLAFADKCVWRTHYDSATWQDANNQFIRDVVRTGDFSRVEVCPWLIYSMLLRRIASDRHCGRFDASDFQDIDEMTRKTLYHWGSV